MKTRATLALAAVAGLASIAQAQETFQVFYSWIEVNAGTTTAVASPNSILEPGEGARIRFGIQALVNGTSAVGQVVNLTTPITNPAGTFSSGTIRGLGSAVYDILGDAGAATANGTWNNLLGPSAPLSSGATGGIPQGAGAIVQGVGGSNFVAPGGTSLTTNPASPGLQVFRGVWNPASYANRTVNFSGRSSVTVPAGQGNAVLVAFNINLGPDGEANTGDEFDDLTGKYFGTDFAQGLNIPIAPAPSSVALIGLGALVAGRRRR